MNTALTIIIVVLTFVVILVFTLFIYESKKENIFGRKKIQTSNNEELEQVISKHKGIFQPFLRFLQKEKLFYTETQKRQITVQIPEGHKYALIETIIVRKMASDELKYSLKLRRGFPSFLSIVKKPIYDTTGVNEFKITKLEDQYIFYSDNPEFWQITLLEDELIAKLAFIFESIRYLTIHKSHVESILTDSYQSKRFLTLILDIRRVMIEVHTSIYDVDVDELYCYNCDDIFDPLEETCDKCGSAKPRCTVCYLDLRAIEEEVVKLPCCGIYSHTNHLLMWFEKKPICPNCRKDLKDYMKKLTMHDYELM